MEKQLKIEKLSDNNYQLWQFKILALLQEKDLDSVLEDDPNEDQDWLRKDKKTRAILRLAVEDDIIPHICSAKTSKETWTILSDMFNQKSGL